MLILGISAKVVPSLVGVVSDRLPSLFGPFILLNAGCLLRVMTQIASDFVPQAFSVVGVSGALEVAAIAWWGLGLVGLMYRSKHLEREALCP